MTSLGLITARAGSKGFPGKNLARLGTHTLLEWTCAAARGARSLTRVVLSTDGDELAAAGRSYGVEAPFLRPAELAQDTSSSLDVCFHALDWLAQNEQFRPEALVLLQPTSPFRTSEHIDEAVTKLQETGADTVVGLIEVPHRFSPYSVVTIEDGWVRNFWTEPLGFDPLRRQNHPQLFARNGPAILVLRCDSLLENRSFYAGKVAPFLMDRRSSLDIDSPEDLAEAEALLQNGAH